MISRRTPGLASLGLGLFVLLIYVLSLSPSVGGGDSGELIAVASRFGVSHPPGYPLHALLGKLFTWLPAGSIAWRVNLLSAVCDAFAAAFLCLAVARWSGVLGAGLFAGGLFAFSPLVWTYAVQAEVFGLHNLFLALLLWVAVEAERSGDRAWPRVGAFGLGLGLCNHHTLLFFGLPLAAWVGVGAWRRGRLAARELFVLAGLFFAGLIPYLYLPLAAAKNPPVAWGDASTWSGFARHLMRSEYGTFRLSVAEWGPGGNVLAKVGVFLGTLPREAAWIGVPFGLIGAARGALGLVVLAASVFYLLVFCGLSNLPLELPLAVTVQARFWQQANLGFFALAGLGAAWGMRRTRHGAGVPGVALASLFVVLLAGAGFRSMDQSRNFVLRDFGVALLGGLPQGALLITRGDHLTNVLRYLQFCEGVRPDVRAVDQVLLRFEWSRRTYAKSLSGVRIPGRALYAREGGFALKDFIDANIGSFPIFFGDVMKDPDPSIHGAYRLWPVGLADRVLPAAEEPEAGEWAAPTLAEFARIDSRALGSYGVSGWEFAVFDHYLSSAGFAASLLLVRALAGVPDARGLLTTTVDLLERAVTAYPNVNPSFYKNLGIAYQRLATWDPSFGAKMKVALREYVERAPRGSDPDIPGIRELLR